MRSNSSGTLWRLLRPPGPAHGHRPLPSGGWDSEIGQPHTNQSTPLSFKIQAALVALNFRISLIEHNCAIIQS